MTYDPTALPNSSSVPRPHSRPARDRAAPAGSRSRAAQAPAWAALVVLWLAFDSAPVLAQDHRETGAVLSQAREAAQAAAAQASRAARALLEPPILSLSATASREVANDRMVVLLFAEREGRDAGAAQAAVNALMAPALERLKRADPAVELETSGWRTWPVSLDGQIKAWRSRASVRVQAAPSEGFATLLSQVSNELVIESLRHELSRGGRERAEAELLAEAAQRFQEKAQAGARALGYREATLRSVSLNNASSVLPLPVARAALGATAVSGAMPIASAEGSTTVTVTLEGAVWLGK